MNGKEEVEAKLYIFYQLTFVLVPPRSSSGSLEADVAGRVGQDGIALAKRLCGSAFSLHDLKTAIAQLDESAERRTLQAIEEIIERQHSVVCRQLLE